MIRPGLLSADEVIEVLGLERLPHEGGWFRETYRSATAIPQEALPPYYPRAARPGRSHSTQIYYMVRPGETSALHRVLSDEVFHHYLGDPVVQLQIREEDRPEAGVFAIGPDLPAGQRPQMVVPAGVWQGLCLASDARPAGRDEGASDEIGADGAGDAWGFALLGCTVAPGFDWADFELITPDHAGTLAARWPEHRPLIDLLTPAPGRTRA